MWALPPKSAVHRHPSTFLDENGSLIYGFMQDNDGADLYATVQSAVDDARAEGADYVILLGHLGNKDYVIPFTYAEVLEHTTGIDAMLDGHSHDGDKVVLKNRNGKPVVRQACGTKWTASAGCGSRRRTGASTPASTPGQPGTRAELLGIQNEMSRSWTAR